MAMELRVPALGESVREATLGAWKHVEGDEVSVDEPIVEVESEKATVEVPSPGAGVLTRILRKPGETVKIGDVIAEIETDGQPAAAPRPEAASATEGNGAPAPTGEPAKASPALRR